MELEQRLTTRLAELKDMRQKYVIDAEKNLAAYDTVISELTQLLAPETEGQTAQAGGAGDLT